MKYQVKFTDDEEGPVALFRDQYDAEQYAGFLSEKYYDEEIVLEDIRCDYPRYLIYFQSVVIFDQDWREPGFLAGYVKEVTNEMLLCAVDKWKDLLPSEREILTAERVRRGI